MKIRIAELYTPQGDKDYYKFTTTVSDNIRVDLSNIPNGEQYTLRLLDSDNEEILQNANTGTSKFFTYNVAANTTYYIYVNGYQGNSYSTSQYSLKLRSTNYSYYTRYFSPSSLSITMKKDSSISGNSTVDGYFTNSRSYWNSAINQVNFSINSNSSNVAYWLNYTDSWVGAYNYHYTNSSFTYFNLYINKRRIEEVTENNISQRPNYYRSVITHELGHVLNLEDNPPTNAESIMKEGRERSEMTQPSQFDIDAVKSRNSIALNTISINGQNGNGTHQNNYEDNDPITESDFEYDSLIDIQTDYVQYENLYELYEEADLVILCTNSSNEVININISNNENGGELVYTVSTVKVDTVLKGNIETGSNIDIKQIGGVYNNMLFSDNSVEQLKNNSQYLLFLETYEGVPASLLNPTQGMYYVEGNTFRPRVGNDISFSNEQLFSLN